ncbi:unnamed protein product [Linum trigynum]|uniref:Nitrate regulatory gene2 protein n=1 Tax=Linum trigynum TaxID=586398 RepID=A0AAV2CFU2_9ROSI
MGCSASRLDGLPAVSLCHDRLRLLDDSLRHSYAFADSHAAYLHSLRSFSPALLSFLRTHASQIAAAPPSDSQPENCTCDGDCKSNSNSNSSSEAPSPNREFSSSSSDSDSDFAAYPKYDSYGGGGGREFAPVARSWITPSPPQPRSSSAWDFLNFFDATPYERYDFVEKEKAEEGASKNQVKEVKSSRNRPDPTRKEAKSTAGKKNRPEPEGKTNVEAEKKKKDCCPKHGNAVDEKVESGEEKKESAAKLMKELDIGFERAAESGNGVLSSLDAGKSRFFSKKSVFQGASVKLFRSTDASGFDGDSGVSTSNLSSTLSKLCMWEKKLYDEVKAEERLRIAYGKCCKKMKKCLADDGGAETRAAADALGATLRTLATQIKVGIQVIDRTSTNINKLREDELFPQITHLIQKLLEMWKSMGETHRAQLEAVSEAQSRGILSFKTKGKLTEEGLQSAMQLKIEIQTWALSFISWVSIQKRCLKSLNGWLLKCLLPGEEGAEYYPPVFALCDKWSNTLEALSEREVIDAVGLLLGGLNKFLEQQQPAHGEEKPVTVDKEVERRVKALEREEQRLSKLLVVHQGIGIWKVFDGKTGDFEVGLKQVFMAMERFAAGNLEAYQQLHAQIEATRSMP